MASAFDALELKKFREIKEWLKAEDNMNADDFMILITNALKMSVPNQLKLWKDQSRLKNSVKIIDEKYEVMDNKFQTVNSDMSKAVGDLKNFLVSSFTGYLRHEGFIKTISTNSPVTIIITDHIILYYVKNN